MEGIRIDDAVEQALLSDPRETNILEAAKPQNIPSMQQDGVMKVLAGITSFDELARVLDLYGALEQAKNELANDAREATPAVSTVPVSEENLSPDVEEITPQPVDEGPPKI